jgi:hypothetical protein
MNIYKESFSQVFRLRIFVLYCFFCAVIVLAVNRQAFAQIEQSKISNSQVDNINIRLARQNSRINSELSHGLIRPDQAQVLKADLRAINYQAIRERKLNYGLLSHQQYTKLENEIRRNIENLEIEIASNRRARQFGNVSGLKSLRGQNSTQNFANK